MFLFLTNTHLPLNTDVREAQTIKYLEEPGSPRSADLSLSIKLCVAEQMGAPVPAAAGLGSRGREEHRCCEDSVQRKKALSGFQSCFHSQQRDRLHPTDQA